MAHAPDPPADGAARRTARFLLQRLGIRSLVALRRGGMLVQDGWFRSFDERKPVDASGRPLPWLTYGAIEFLGPRLRPDMRVFEFGCGWGTLWWAARVARVVACEHDETWFREMRPRMPENASLLHVPFDGGGEYARMASRSPGAFDIVVIDGRDRVRCARHSLSALTRGGVFVWDNTDRERYASGLEELAGRGFRRIDFVGLVPGSTAKAQTTVLYRAENVLGI